MQHDLSCNLQKKINKIILLKTNFFCDFLNRIGLFLEGIKSKQIRDFFSKKSDFLKKSDFSQQNDTDCKGIKSKQIRDAIFFRARL